MNANAVPRTMCSNCKFISENMRPLNYCERKVKGNDGNQVICGGTYHVTNGFLFKAKHSYSKTLKRNMKKHGLDPMEFSDSIRAYKEIRKKRKQAQSLVRKDKHSTAKAQRGSKSQTTKKK